MIREQRVGANQTLHELLKQLKVAYLADISTCDTKHKSRRNCNRPQLIAHFDRELKRLDIQATPKNVEENGARHFLDKLISFVPCVPKGYHGCTPSSHGFEYLNRLPVRKAGHLDGFPIGEARYSTHGLCMICVKQGKLSASPDSFCAWHYISDTIRRLTREERGDREQDIENLHPFWTWAKHDIWNSYKDLGMPSGARSALGDLLNHNCMSSTRWQHEQ